MQLIAAVSFSQTSRMEGLCITVFAWPLTTVEIVKMSYWVIPRLYNLFLEYLQGGDQDEPLCFPRLVGKLSGSPGVTYSSDEHRGAWARLQNTSPLFLFKSHSDLHFLGRYIFYS